MGLGMMYYLGEEFGAGVRQDLEQALYWLNMAAERGSIDAEAGLGMVYMMQEDIGNAQYWLQKAADKGHADAGFMLQMLTLFE